MENRRCFLMASSAGMLLGTPYTTSSLAQDNRRNESKISSTTTPPKVVASGEGTKVWAMGVLVTIKVRASDTNNAYSVFEDLVLPGAGPVPHVHVNEDETMYILEGELRAWLDGQQYDLKVGDFVHMPRGVEHYFKNVSTKPTRMLLSYTPGGFEKWFLDIGKPFAPEAKNPPETTQADVQAAIIEAKKYGVQFRKP